jgi:hypothetical protein
VAARGARADAGVGHSVVLFLIISVVGHEPCHTSWDLSKSLAQDKHRHWDKSALGMGLNFAGMPS